MTHRDIYSNLLTPTCNSTKISISESTTSYQFIRERHLQAMWLEQKYFSSLYTEDGNPIIVLSPGIWNGEAGPDFLRAHIKIGDQEFRGDIEIHLSDDGWFQHQHHIDKKYDNVILHVGYWKPKSPLNLTTSEGRALPCTYIEEKLTIPEARILKLIDLDLYPYKHFVGSGTCANTLFRNLPSHDVHHFFRQAAIWRLDQKYQHLQAKIDNPIDLLLGGMSMALGYKHNADTFLQLFYKLKQQPQMDEPTLLAYAIGLCGFFNEKYRQQWMHSVKYQTLAWRYDALSPELKNQTIPLNLERTRPANHPIRRLACLVKMMFDPCIGNLYEALGTVWSKYFSSDIKKSGATLRTEFMETFPSYHDIYWEHHYIFEKEDKKASISMIGDDLKRETFINAYLPLLFNDIKERGDVLEKEAFLNFYSTLPASNTRKGKYLMHRFFGDTQKRKILDKADMQQGAYQLHRDFCIHYEASCIGCPFVQRYQVVFGNEAHLM